MPSPPRRGQPSNVVALSPYRARLGRGRRLRRADALYAAPDLEAAVRALPGDELYYVVHEIGLRDAGDVLASATPDQLQIALDLAIWAHDRIAVAPAVDWLEAMAAAPVERIALWLRGLDTELVALLIRRSARIYDLTQEEAPDDLEGLAYETPDGFFLLDVLGLAPDADDAPAPAADGGERDRARLLVRLVDSLYRVDQGFARRILVGARSELDAELEESAYRWRQARLADLGFADYYEALEVYRELDPASVGLADDARPAGPVRTVIDAGARTDEAALRVPTALAERLADAAGSPFARAAQKLSATDDIDDLRFALVALTNRVLAADRVGPGDDAAVTAVIERMAATLDIAIERLARGEDDRGALALRAIPLVRLFRLGVSLIGKVRRLAAALRRDGPFGPRGFALAEADDAAVLEAVTRLRPLYPRVLDDPPAGDERPFATLGDIARAAAAIEQAAAAQALLRGLGVTAADIAPGAPALVEAAVDEAALDVGVLARTALVRRLVAADDGAAAVPTLRPLAARELRAFEALLRARRGGPPALPPLVKAKAKAILAGAAPPTLAVAAEIVADRWIASLAPLEPVLVRAAGSRDR